MKRVLLLFCTAILITCFFSGCVLLPDGRKEVTDGSSGMGINSTETDSLTTDSSETKTSDLKALQQKISQSGGIVGVAFIGYVNSESTEEALRTYLTDSESGKKYLFLSGAPLFMTEGQELYAIVPVNDNGRITVYPSAMTDSGEYADNKDDPLYRGKLGQVILLRCNLSEIYSNVLITASDGGGAIEFRPAISMKNGRLQDYAGVYDFSVYSEEEGLEDDVMNAHGLLLETDEIKFYTDKGMILQYTGQTQVIDGQTCLVFALGTNHDDQFVREIYYAVCGNIFYVYDAVSDTWNPLGTG